MYKLERLQDHKEAYEIIKYFDPYTTTRALHNAQNDIYVIYNNEVDRYVGVIYGERSTETHHYASSSTASTDGIYVPMQIFTITRFFNAPGEPTISAGMWYSSLLEVLADKNNMHTYYTLTGEETPEMIEAMKRIGFAMKDAPEKCYLVKDFLRHPVRY